MSMMYNIGLPPKTVSFVIRLIDTYTNKAVINQVFASIEGAEPIIKNDGYIVFTDVAPNDYEISIGGTMFFSEKITVPQNELFPKESDKPAIINLYLTPNSRYIIPPRSMYVSADFSKYCPPVNGTKLQVRPDTGIKVLYCDDDIIKINCRDANVEGRLLVFADTTKIFESFVMGERIDSETYKLTKKLQNDYTKEIIYPLSLGITDMCGYLFMPVWGAGGTAAKAYVYALDNTLRKETIIKTKN